MKEVMLGHRVRDAITGYEGIAFQETLLLSGTVQLAVQPQMSDDQKKAGADMPGGMSMDIHTLEYVDEGLRSRVITPPAVSVKLGERVKDQVTGVCGMVTSRVTFLNGCVYFNVQQEADKDGKVPDPLFLDHKRLKKIDDGISATVAQEPPVQPKATPGGPMSRAQRPT